MAGKLTQKETTMLQDQIRHEEVCVRKYTEYAGRTADAALRGMFYEFAQDEQNHHNTLNGLLSGSPAGRGTQSQQSQQSQQAQQTQQSRPQQAQSRWPEPMPGQTGSQQTGQEVSRELVPMFRAETAQEFAGGTGLGESESSILQDMLMTEQFVSSSYDSAVFDAVSPQVRQTLQYIQKDEQKHGQGIRDYMQRKGLGGSQQ